MARKRFSKLVSLAVCACMAAPWQVPVSAFAQGAEDMSEQSATAELAVADAAEEAEEVVPQDYQRQYFADMYANGQVQVDNTGVALSVDEQAKSLMVSGKKKALNSSTITISKTFDFSEAAVGRFSIAGLAQKTKHVDLAFCLDGQDEPFFTTQLEPQENDDDWTYPKEESCNMLSLNLTGQHTLSFKISVSSPSPSFSLSYVEFAESSVPILDLDIDESLGTIEDMNMSENHSVNCYGSVSIDVPQGYTSPLTDETLKGTDGSLDLEYIRGRGNSTWSDEVKKPYKFKLDSSTGLLGMGKSKHWALIANAMDKTEMRDFLTGWLGKEMGDDFTLVMEPIEVIMNGEYLGSYMLSETVRVEKNRVNISDLDDTPDATDDATISGGYLLSLGNWTLDSEKLNFTTEKAKGIFQVESPDLYTSKNTTQFNYIKNYVQSVEDAIYTDGDYASLMDLESAARYFWFQELSTNGDGFTSGSCYLYKDRGGKLKWDPLWDFDLAWGCNDGSADYQGARAWAQTEKFWNSELFKDQSYVDVVKSLWPAFKEKLQQLTAQGGMLDKIVAAIRTSVVYNNEHWGIGDESGQEDAGEEGNEDGQEAVESEDEPEVDALVAGAANFDTAVSYLRSWIETRTQWVDENLSTLDPQPVTVTFKNKKGKVLKTKTYYLGKSFGSLPSAPAKSGYVFIGWKTTVVTTLEEHLEEFGMTEEEYRSMLIDSEGMTEEQADEEIARYKAGVKTTEYVEEDSKVASEGQVLTAAYMKRSSITKISKIYSPYKTYYCVYDAKDNANLLRLPIQVEPFSPVSNKVTCTVSNNSVLEPVGEEGEAQFSVKNPGDSKVTLTPLVGKPITVKVHVYSQAEVDEEGISGAYFSFKKRKMTITKGEYAAIPFSSIEEGSLNTEFPDLFSIDQSVVSVGSGGVIYGEKAGKTTVCLTNDGSVYCCEVTVKSTTPMVGDQVTLKGLKYQVTSAKKKSCKVACIGVAKKSVKTARIPKTVKVKGTACKVEAVASNAFKGCKSLRKVVIRSSNRLVVYPSAFKGVSSKCKLYVPKGQKAYYKAVLKGHTVVVK